MVSPVQSPVEEWRVLRKSWQTERHLHRNLPTYDIHVGRKHQGHANRNAKDIVAHQVAQSADHLFAGSSENPPSDSLHGEVTVCDQITKFDRFLLVSNVGSYRDAVKKMGEAKDKNNARGLVQNLS